MTLFGLKKENKKSSAAMMIDLSLKKLQNKDKGEKSSSSPEWLQHWKVTPKSSVEFRQLF